MSEQKNPLKFIASCQNEVTKFYQRNIRQQTELLTRIKTKLPPPLAEHVLSCVISGKKLVLYSDAEQWLPLLIFYQPTILDLVSETTFAAIKTMEVRVLARLPEQQTIRQIEIPSKNNIDLLRHTVDAVEDDNLKQALLRLSKTLDRLSKIDSLK